MFLVVIVSNFKSYLHIGASALDVVGIDQLCLSTPQDAALAAYIAVVQTSPLVEYKFPTLIACTRVNARWGHHQNLCFVCEACGLAVFYALSFNFTLQN